ncbi:MAG: hypothetical protein J7M27_11880 [Candidatus Latescibacteria bacterium]|nr:hypothetical protein [Candidatus Latescibacterota bacterium]
MSERFTGRIRDRIDLERMDQMTEAEIEEAARLDPDSLLLEDCDLSTLSVVMPREEKAISLREV